MDDPPPGSLLAESDIVSLQLPMQPETRPTIDREALGRMKPTAVLVNATRGGLIDSVALVEALKAEKSLPSASMFARMKRGSSFGITGRRISMTTSWPVS